MTDSTRDKPFSTLNLVLLFLACLASLGTLAPDHNTGRPEAMINEWPGEARTFTVTVVGAEALVPAFDASASHIVTVEIGDIPMSTVETALWNLRVEGNDTFSLSGSFTSDGDADWFTEDDEIPMGNMEMVAGSICSSDDSDAPDCIPCSLTEGCTLKLEVDLCQPSIPQNTYVMMHIQPENMDYEVTCHKDEDQTPCEMLDSWMTMESAPLEDSLCDNPEDSDERATEDADNATME